MFKLTMLIVILTVLCVVATAAPYQELAPKAGYVPVYIREGNTPLSEIHPKLVEAFHEDGDYSQLQAESLKTEEVSPISNAEEKIDVKEDKEEEIKKETNKSADFKINDKTDESVKEEKAKVEETTDSDIAEFNSDDLKTLTDE